MYFCRHQSSANTFISAQWNSLYIGAFQNSERMQFQCCERLKLLHLSIVIAGKSCRLFDKTQLKSLTIFIFDLFLLRVCVRVCVRTHTRAHTCTCGYVCMCVTVWVWRWWFTGASSLLPPWRSLCLWFSGPEQVLFQAKLISLIKKKRLKTN